MAQKAPRAALDRRTTYQGAGARSSGKGSVVTTGGSGSTVTVNPGKAPRSATRTVAPRTSPAPAPSRGAGGSRGSAGRSGPQGPAGKPARQKSFLQLEKRSGGSGVNYQAVVLGEFVAAELLVAISPISTKKGKQGLSPYASTDMVKLMSIGVVYFILALLGSANPKAGRFSAWFGALVLIVLGMNEASSLAGVFKAIAGGTGKDVTTATLTAAQKGNAAKVDATTLAIQSAPPITAAQPNTSSTGGSGGGGGGGGGPVSGKTGSSLVQEAGKFIGDPYVWGAAGPSSFDCSGLVQYSLERLGLKNVPRTSEEQWAWVHHISESALQPGDLVFEQWPGEASPGHVAIYAGSGQIIQAPAPGEDVQKVPWSPSIVHGEGGTIVGYGRVPGLNYGAAPGLQVQ